MALSEEKLRLKIQNHRRNDTSSSDENPTTDSDGLYLALVASSSGRYELLMLTKDAQRLWDEAKAAEAAAAAAQAAKPGRSNPPNTKGGKNAPPQRYRITLTICPFNQSHKLIG